MSKKSETQVSDLTFEQALAELEKIVSGLESGSVPLEASIEMYERGDALRAHCDALLRKAEARIEKITASEGKATGTEPFDAD